MAILNTTHDVHGIPERSQFDEHTRAIFLRGLRPVDSDGEKGVAECAAPHLWGESPPMLHVFDMVERVAPTNANVLLIGESGTGKEVIAQRLHYRSPRIERTFLAINCGAIAPGLIEAELFGHERGSFTGAVRSNKGVFERAGGGTLFLDEITEMPLDMQAKLLRVLETGRFFRVGGDTETTVRCRIIAATNRNPEQAVADGVLRADLLYRLAVFPLRLPALRERGMDIDLIADRFVAQLNTDYCGKKRLSADARRFLHEHSWPGNVRELKNSIHRAYILTDHELEFSVDEPAAADCSAADTDQVVVPIGTSIADMEHKLIMATLTRCDGHKRQTAKILGISLKTLYNRLNDYARFAPAAHQTTPRTYQS